MQAKQDGGWIGEFYVLTFPRSLTTAALGVHDWTLAFSHKGSSMRPDLFYIGVQGTKPLSFWSVNSRASCQRDKILVDWQLQATRTPPEECFSFQLFFRDKLAVGGRIGA